MKRFDTVTNLFADLCGDIGDGALRDAGEDGRFERVPADMFNEAQNPWSDGRDDRCCYKRFAVRMYQGVLGYLRPRAASVA
jgi:hypothetical protein